MPSTVMKTDTFVFYVILSVIYSVQALSAYSPKEPSLNIPANVYDNIVYEVGDKKAIFCVANNVKHPVEWISPLSGHTVGAESKKNRHVYVERQLRKNKEIWAILIFNGLNLTDSGIWTCKSGNLSVAIEFFVGEKVVMPTEIEAIRDEGHNAILTCEAKGYPEPVVTWYKDGIWLGITIGFSENHKYEIRKKDNTYTLEIRRLRHADSGEYTCKATQQKLYHYAEKIIKLTVYPTVTITSLTVPATAKVGEDVELACHYIMEEKEVESFYVKWWWTPLDAGPEQKRLISQRLRHGQKFGSVWFRFKAEGIDTVKLVNLTVENSGKYECEVSNDLHEDRRSSDLVVYTFGSGPMLSVTPATDGASGNTVYRVTCEATGVAPEPRLAIHYTTAHSREAPITDLIKSRVDSLHNVTARLTLDDADSGTMVECYLYLVSNKVTIKSTKITTYCS